MRLRDIFRELFDGTYFKNHDFVIGGDEYNPQANSAVGKWWKAKTGQEMSGAELQASDINAAEAQKTRDFSEYMYNQYESPKAMMRQFEEAGVNSALMFGGNMPSPSVPTGSAQAVSPHSETPILGDMFNMISGAIGLKQQVDLNRAEVQSINAQAGVYKEQERLTKEQADYYANENEWYDAHAGNKFNMDWETVHKIQADTSLAEQQVHKMYYEIDEILSNTARNYSEIELNGVKVELVGAETQKEKALTTLYHINAHELQTLLPLTVQLREAEIKLTEANTEERKTKAYENFQNAQLQIVYKMREQGLIDAGYYNELVRDIKARADKTTVDMYVENVCRIIHAGCDVKDTFFGDGKNANNGVKKAVAKEVIKAVAK